MNVMETNWYAVVGRLLMMACFIGIYWWAFGKGRKTSFDEAANLPFIDEVIEREANLEKGKQL